MPRNLPDFDNPPLTEVALSVQFEPLEQLRTPQIGLLWSKFRNRFPHTEEYAPLEPVIEQFGGSRATTPEVRIQMLNSLPGPRVWFINQGGTELIQVQQDRFVHNWRKRGEGDAYPRYEQIRDTFQEELATFQSMLSSDNIGPFNPNQCEVTYVNHIVSGSGWNRHGELGNVLTVFNTAYSDENLSEPEDVRFALRYVLKGKQDNPKGRLHVSAQPAYLKSDDRPMIMLTLTARIQPQGESLDAVIEGLNTGRDAIVRAFASLTTPEMHKLWRRKDV